MDRNQVNDTPCLDVFTGPSPSQAPRESSSLATPVRSKGRPKGEKNSKVRPKGEVSLIGEENLKSGRWQLGENKRYHWFLEIYNKHFICKEMRRLDRIFKTMAVFIGTREAQQCRSHHQKMEKKHITFPKILLFLRKIHYGTENASIVMDDMLANDVKNIGQLVEQSELESLQQTKESTTSARLEEEAKVSSDNELFAQKQEQLQSTWEDFFGENYEHRFNFCHFLS